jgi:hypothetical protein
MIEITRKWRSVLILFSGAYSLVLSGTFVRRPSVRDLQNG